MPEITLEKIIGENLARYRNLEGLTQSQLAERIGITTAAISRVERGLKMMKVRTLFATAQAPNVSCDALLHQEAAAAHLENIKRLFAKKVPPSSRRRGRSKRWVCAAAQARFLVCFKCRTGVRRASRPDAPVGDAAGVCRFRLPAACDPGRGALPKYRRAPTYTTIRINRVKNHELYCNCGI